MRILSALIRNRRYIPGYIKKYSAQAARRAAYGLRKAAHVDSYARIGARLEKALALKPGALGEYVKSHAVRSLLHADAEAVCQALLADAAFMAALRETADRALSHELLILNRFIAGTFDAETGHTRWDTDFATGYRYRVTHYTRARAGNQAAGVDIKNLWELSRMQYLFAPALLYKLTGEGKYAAFVRDTLLDWTRGNAWEEGPNWQPSMESGIRAANMLLAFQLILGSDEADAAFCARMLSCAALHQRFILQNEEKLGGRTSNHYLGALTGLSCIATTFPFLPGEAKTAEYAFTSFAREMEKQILPDGGGFEGSTQYQQLIGEMFCIARVAAANTGRTLPPAFDAGLARAAAFSEAMRCPDGTWTQIGDNDGGHIFRLLPTSAPDGAAFVSLANLLLRGEAALAGFPREITLFGGMPATDAKPRAAQDGVRLMPDSHIALYRGGEDMLTLSAVDVHAYGMGGHTHGDKLSVTLHCGGKPFIVDPGSGTYTGDPAVRNALRGTAQHSTVQLDGREQCGLPQSGALFGIGHETRVLALNAEARPGGAQLSGEICYEKGDFSYSHRRTLEIDAQTRRITLLDALEASAAPKGAVCRFVLHPDVNVSAEENRAYLENGGVRITLEADAPIRISEGLYSGDYGQWEKTRVLALPLAFSGKTAQSRCTLAPVGGEAGKDGLGGNGQ